MKTAYLAGGCFWGVEDLLRKVPGIIATEVGYTGGTTDNPTYNDIKTGKTGHAEAIRIDYDPNVLSYEKLLELFFRLHDPTTRNRQGNDIGTQYRSAIFYQNDEELKAAEDVIRDQSGFWKREITTSLEPFKKFYSAEDYHQDYLVKNPGGYTCHYWRESAN
jgi:methionine-S-sulfoxide reductase